MCSRCGEHKPATVEFFFRKSKANLQLVAACKTCVAARSRAARSTDGGKYRRQQSDAQKRHRLTPHGRAKMLVGNYRMSDRKRNLTTDLSIEWLMEHILPHPCTYCGDSEEPRGADRVDNALGHLKSNVVPACTSCNLARGDRFSAQEMHQILGPAIAQAKAARLSPTR